MRFAGDYLSNSLEGTPAKDKPLVEGFNTEDFQQAPQEVAVAPAVVAGLGLISKGAKAWSAFKVGQALLDGGPVHSGTKHGPGKRTVAYEDPTAAPGTIVNPAYKDPTVAPGGRSDFLKQMSQGSMGAVPTLLNVKPPKALGGAVLNSIYHQ